MPATAEAPEINTTSRAARISRLRSQGPILPGPGALRLM